MVKLSLLDPRKDEEEDAEVEAVEDDPPCGLSMEGAGGEREESVGATVAAPEQTLIGEACRRAAGTTVRIVARCFRPVIERDEGLGRTMPSMPTRITVR